MAEHTRLKDLAAEMKTLQAVSEERESAIQNTISQLQLTCTHIESEHSRRMDRLEGVVRESHRSMDLMHHKLEVILKSPALVAQTTPSSSFGGYSHNSHHQSTSPRVKIDFPKFDGTDPLNWIFKAEQYFSFYETADLQRIVLASVHF